MRITWHDPPSPAARLLAALSARLLRGLGTTLRPLAPAGDADTVLVLAPHPDDEVIGCGAAIEAHVAAGHALHVAYMTDGRHSRHRILGPTQVAAARRAEGEQVRRHYGYAALHHLGTEDGTLASAPGVVARLAELLDALRPGVIYLPHTFDYHPDHAAVYPILVRTAYLERRPLTRLRCYETQATMGAAGNRVHLFATASMRDKVAACRMFASQDLHLDYLPVRAAAYAAALGQPGYGELFTETSAAAYDRALAQLRPGAPLASTLRGWQLPWHTVKNSRRLGPAARTLGGS